MGGGIKYRLTPQERELFGDSIPMLQSVLDRLEKGGVRLQLTDPEMSVTSEETPTGTSFLLVYPLDNDNRQHTGRIYLQDEFILSREDQRVLQFKRSFRQDVDRDRHIPFWVDLAKADHPAFKSEERRAHLELFLRDLEKIPSPPLYDGDLVEFHGKVVKNLHRPFPPDFKKIVQDNPSVYGDVAAITTPFGIQVLGFDPQSGAVAHKEGNQIFLKLVLVLDNNRGPDGISREISRIFLTDEFVLDADTHELMKFKRSFASTPALDTSHDRALAELTKAAPPPLDSIELRNLASRTTRGLGFLQNPVEGRLPDSVRLLASFNTRNFPKWGSMDFSAGGDKGQASGLALQLAHTASEEYLEKLTGSDQAWFKPSSGSSSNADPESRREALKKYLSRVGTYLTGNQVTLREALKQVPAEGPFEEFLRDRLLSERTLQRLFSILEEPDSENRRNSLLHLIQTDLDGEAPWPNTVTAILGSLDANDPAVREWTDWYSGKANFGRRFERVLPHMASELTSPRMIAGMMAANTLASFGKMAFIGRFGHQGLGLRLGAEGAALLVEAPAFVLTEKILTSGFQSPVGVWNHWYDLAGAYLAFGVLRGAGYGSGRLNHTLRNRYFHPELSLEQFAQRPAERWLYRLGQWRAWTPGAVQGVVRHGGGLGSLILANSLARSLGMRPKSGHGWPSDWADDLILYGQFLIGGSIAERLRAGTPLKEIDLYLAWMERNPGVKSPESSPIHEILSPEATPAPVSGTGTSRIRRWLEGLRGLPQRLSRSPGQESGEAGPPAPVPASRLQNLARRLETHFPRVFAWLSPPPPNAPAKNGGFGETTYSSEAVENAPREMMPPEFYKTGPIPIFAGTGKPVEADAFLKAKFIPLPKNDPEKKEWILGRDDPQGVMRGDIPDVIFPDRNPGILPRHARIFLQEVAKPSGAPEDKSPEYFLEPLDGTTFFNGFGLDSSAGPQGPLQTGDLIQLGENGKRLTFKIDSSNQFAFLEEDLFPLDLKYSEWRFGRNTLKGEVTEIPVPSLERQVSRLHARIFRDGEGQYYIQDLSNEGTWVEGRRVYGTMPLFHKDKIQLGREQFDFKGPEAARAFKDAKTFWFELPKTKTRPPANPPEEPAFFPKNLPPPAQAEVHPFYRGLSGEEVAAFVQKKREEWEATLRHQEALGQMGLSAAQVREAGLSNEEDPTNPILLAELKFSNQMVLELESDKTGYVIGAKPGDPSDPANTFGIEMPGASGLAPRHALFYVDTQGRFILRDLDTPNGVYVHARAYRDMEEPNKDGSTSMVRKWREIPESLPFLQRISGWTILQGGERVYLGRNFFFDFWPGSLKPNDQRPISGSGESPPPTQPFPPASAPKQDE